MVVDHPRNTIYSTIARSVGRWLVLRWAPGDDCRSLELPVDLRGDEPPAGRATLAERFRALLVTGPRSIGRRPSRFLPIGRR